MKLQFARHRQIALQSLFFLRDAFVEPSVFDGDCDLRRQRGDGPHVVFSEKPTFGVFQVEDADLPDLVHCDAPCGHR